MCRLVDAMVTNSEFDLNVAAGSGGGMFASNMNYSVVIVDSGFDRNKAAGERVPGSMCIGVCFAAACLSSRLCMPCRDAHGITHHDRPSREPGLP